MIDNLILDNKNIKLLFFKYHFIQIKNSLDIIFGKLFLNL